jgi:hypothetical protein
MTYLTLQEAPAREALPSLLLQQERLRRVLRGIDTDLEPKLCNREPRLIPYDAVHWPHATRTLQPCYA